jgi:hypothetical protein
MAFPRTRDELIAAGYKFSNHAVCRGCKKEIEWYETPAGKKAPFDLMQDGSSPVTSHFATCSEAASFRK